MRTRRRSGSLTMLAVLLLVASPTALAVPLVLHHEGLILEEDGLPLEDDSVSIRFTLYDASANGAVLWFEDHTVVAMAGYYRVTFGEQRSLATALAADGAWLGISIEGAPELRPRHALGAVPYAFVAGNAVGDLTPNSVTVGGRLVVDGSGNWVGPVTSILESLRDLAPASTRTGSTGWTAPSSSVRGSRCWTSSGRSTAAGPGWTPTASTTWIALSSCAATATPRPRGGSPWTARSPATTCGSPRATASAWAWPSMMEMVVVPPPPDPLPLPSGLSSAQPVPTASAVNPASQLANTEA